MADSPLPHSDQKPLAYQFMNQAAPERAAELCEMADSPLPHSDEKPLAYQFMNRNNHCGVYVECIMYWYYTINLKNEHGSGYRRCRNSMSFNPTKPTGFGSTRTSPAGFTVRFGTYSVMIASATGLLIIIYYIRRKRRNARKHSNNKLNFKGGKKENGNSRFFLRSHNFYLIIL